MGSERLVERLQKLAEEERAKILNDMEERIEGIRRAAEEELATFREERERFYRKESERLRNLILSSARRKAKETLAAAKEEVIWEVITRTKESLKGFSGEEYIKWLLEVIEGGEELLGKDSLIFPVREEDLPELKKRFGERVKESLINSNTAGLNPRVASLIEEYVGADLIGGVIMVAPDGSMIGDYTLAGRLKRKHEEIRERVSRALFGEEAV
ncbi:MAG: hypothetical protein DRN40_05360 [Thermoplasmata archaeon]|nr:MAG: hypothetical protein DRN28_03030 [Thermoplasmata archaeon]RLF70098.1 MAG: hypothetical protein DRN40_05360 [Thermoplasmata archaeon]RLF70778.1 MAG: hypothetical protein DRN55_08170 [Thermoplasmata archaeon]